MDAERHPHLSSFLELTPDAVIIINAEGLIVFSNEYANKIFGYEKGELLNKQLEILLPPEYRTKHVQHRQNFFQRPTKRPMGAGMQLTGLKCNGAVFAVEISLSHLILDNQTAAMGIIRDLSDRRRLETNFHGLLEAAPDGIMMVNSKGQIVVVNSQMEKLFGYERSELIMQPIEILIPERYHHAHQHYRNAYLQTPSRRAMGEGRELAARRKDGTEWPVEISLSAIVIENEVHAIAIVRDITVRKNSERQIIEARELALSASNAKTDFLANVSHEIRTPLHGICGLADLLYQTKLEPEQREYVESIKQCSDSLVVLINDILDISKIDAGKMRLTPTHINIGALIAEVTQFFRVMSMGKSVGFNCVLENFVLPMWVEADMGRLRQIVMNLVSNAVKFTDEGSVTLVFAVMGETPESFDLKVSVQDTGIGVPDGQKEKLFQMFSQLDNSTTKRHAGTGLGLIISKRLVELMDGKIGFAPATNGSVFWFTITLPRSAPPTAGPPLHYLQTSKRSSSAPASPLPEHSPLPLDPLRMCTGIHCPTHSPNTHCQGAPISPVSPVSSHDSMTPPTPNAASNLPHSAASSPSLPRAGSTQSGTRVLLVDDNAINLRLATKMISSLNMEVGTARDGVEALQTLETDQEGFDIILMDIQMPRMDGFEATSEARKRGVTCPIIALTASAYKDDIERCLTAGMDDHLPKPVKAGDLEKMIHRWIFKGSQRASGSGTRSRILPPQGVRMPPESESARSSTNDR
ncbi:hypothetical protein DFS34DRAFT_650056 [Phlyctochytrium arcticum]|nr:hypothetical protein DFS34DRAFT_650056 [Phlyctochytrium arcticum]